MQCALSMTSSPAVAASRGSTWSRKSGLFNRSGLTSSTSTAPALISAYTASHCAALVELTVTARMPARSAASIWLRISASSGETITVGPAPVSYTHLRAHETPEHLVCRLLLEKQKKKDKEKIVLTKEYKKKQNKKEQKITQ